METEKRFECILKKFELHLKEEEKSQNTIAKYIRDIQRFKAFAENRTMNRQLVLDYKAYLKQKYAIISANSMLAALNSFLRFCGRAGWCVKQYKVQREAYCTEEKELTKEDYLSLINTADREGNHRLSLVIQTLCAAGIRVSELPYITVEALQRGEAAVSCKGKTRTVFIAPKLRKKLLAYAKKQGIREGMIFVTKGGKPLNRSNIWKSMKALCKKAGVNSKKVFPHNLRHLFARVFYGMEKDIVKLADILGHSNINTTRIYIISTGAEHKRRIERMRLII